jgi:hypothetical protein
MKLVKSYGGLPLHIIENKGQVPTKAPYYLKSEWGAVYFTKEGISYHLIGRKAPPKTNQNSELKRHIFFMKPVGADQQVRLVAGARLPGKINYFIGNDPAKWQRDIPIYGEIFYKGLYEGIDLKVYGSNGAMEYDFIVSPGADPLEIKMAFEGVDALNVNAKGDLTIKTPLGEMTHLKPIIYQEIEGKKCTVAGRYRLVQHTVSFAIEGYDKRYPLIIDPITLFYSTFFGEANEEIAEDIAVDSKGYAYIAGHTNSDLTGGDLREVFVAKISPDGKVVYETYLGGSKQDKAHGIGVDKLGYVYITGETASDDFPLGGSGFQGIIDAFVATLNLSFQLSSASYLGGSGWDLGDDIAVDEEGNAYVTGYTSSGNFPVLHAYQETYGGGGQDAFVAKFDSSGDKLYATYLGGTGFDYGHGIAIGINGSAWVTGETKSKADDEGQGGFPTADPTQEELKGDRDAFVTQLSPGGTGLLFSTYLGGDGSEHGRGIGVYGRSFRDGGWTQMIYVTGETSSKEENGKEGFPTELPFQSSHGGGTYDAFVTNYHDSSEIALSVRISSYLGGEHNEWAGDIAAGKDEWECLVTGMTASGNFPTTEDAFSRNYSGGAGDAFVTVLSDNYLKYSSFLGGSGKDDGKGIAVDRYGSFYVTGMTWSGDFPTTPGVEQETHGGASDAFVTKFARTRSLESIFPLLLD